MNDEIFAALENSAPNRKARGRIGDPVTPDQRDYMNWRDSVMRFLDDLEGDLTVDDLRQGLEEYP